MVLSYSFNNSDNTWGSRSIFSVSMVLLLEEDEEGLGLAFILEVLRSFSSFSFSLLLYSKSLLETESFDLGKNNLGFCKLNSTRNMGRGRGTGMGWGLYY